MSGWLNFEAPYQSILRHVKDHGIRVYHRTIKGGAAGYYDHNKCIITIDKKYKNKVEGCYFLCHELIHYNQARYNEFPGFFTLRTEFSQEKLDLVIAAEMDAITKGSKMLRMWGIDYQPSELTNAGFKESVAFWKKYYFNID